MIASNFDSCYNTNNASLRSSIHSENRIKFQKDHDQHLHSKEQPRQELPCSMTAVVYSLPAPRSSLEDLGICVHFE